LSGLVAMAYTLVIMLSKGPMTKSVVVLVSVRLAKSKIPQTTTVVMIPK